MKYKKKPIIIEAFKWNQQNLAKSQPSWFVDAITTSQIWSDGTGSLLINTLEGTLRVSEGDYIIQGIKGELYPCKSDIFENSYEKVDNE